MKISSKAKKVLMSLLLVTLLVSVFSVTAYAAALVPIAASGNISTAVNNAFNTYLKPQIKSIVSVAVLGCIDAALLIMFVIKVVTAGIEYHKRGGQFEWTVPAVLFAGLVLSVSASVWMWQSIGW